MKYGIGGGVVSPFSTKSAMPFRNATAAAVPQAAILFDKFHVMRHLAEALDRVRRSEYRRLSGKDRRFIKGQRYTLLSHRENLSLEGKRSLKLVLTARRTIPAAQSPHLHVASPLKCPKITHTTSRRPHLLGC